MKVYHCESSDRTAIGIFNLFDISSHQTLSHLYFKLHFLGDFLTFHGQTSLIKTHILTRIPCTGQCTQYCESNSAHTIVSPGCMSLVNLSLLQVKRRPGMLCREYQRLLPHLAYITFQVQ